MITPVEKLIPSVFKNPLDLLTHICNYLHPKADVACFDNSIHLSKKMYPCFEGYEGHAEYVIFIRFCQRSYVNVDVIVYVPYTELLLHELQHTSDTSYSGAYERRFKPVMRVLEQHNAVITIEEINIDDYRGAYATRT